MTTTITFANLKGGVGKSLSAWMVARHLHARKRRVLLIDIDPRATLTGWSGVVNRIHIGHVLGGAVKPAAGIRTAAQIGEYDIAIVPSHIDLVNVGHGLQARQFNRIEALRNAIRDTDYDVVLVDSPGAAEVLMINGLYAADLVVIPTQPEPASIAAVKETLDIISQVRAAKHGGIDIYTIITMADERTNSHRAGISRIQNIFDELPIIPERKGIDADDQLFAAYAPVADWIEQYTFAEVPHVTA